MRSARAGETATAVSVSCSSFMTSGEPVPGRELFRSEVEFLGHRVGAAGVRMMVVPGSTEVKRQATTAHSFGLEMHLLTPKEAQELWPLM